MIEGVLMDENVKDYIEKQDSHLKKIIKKVRDLFFELIPNCDEKMAWGLSVYGGDRFYIAAMKNRVHVGFSIIGLEKDEIKLFEGSGKTMRHIKLHSLNDIDDKKLIELIKLVDKKAICPPN